MNKPPNWPTLKARLANPLTTRVEAIEQLKTMMIITPLAQRVLDRSKKS